MMQKAKSKPLIEAGLFLSIQIGLVLASPLSFVGSFAQANPDVTLEWQDSNQSPSNSKAKEAEEADLKLTQEHPILDRAGRNFLQKSMDAVMNVFNGPYLDFLNTPALKFLNNIDLKAKVLGMDKFSHGIGFDLRWDRNIDPSFRKDQMTLIDTIQGKLNIMPKALTKTFDGKIGIGASVSPSIKMVFARQRGGSKFINNIRTFLSGPPNVVDLPILSAESAKISMGTEDFFSYQANLNVVASASQINAVSPHLTSNIGGYWLLSGEFQVHIFRLDDKHFRIKLFTIQNDTKGLFANLGFKPNTELKAIPVKFVRNGILRRLSFNPVSISKTGSDIKLFMVDYVLNLDDERAVTAYNSVIGSTWKWKIFNKINPLTNGFKDIKDLEKSLLTDVSQLDELHDMDVNKANDQRAVVRKFQGDNRVNAGGFNITLGQKDVAQAAYSSSLTTNQMTIVDQHGKLRYYTMPVFSKNSFAKAFLGFFSIDGQASASMLFESNQNFDLTTFGELSFYSETRDKNFTAKDAKDLKDKIRKRLPVELYEKIDWGNWKEDRLRRHARVTYLLVIRPAALDIVKNISQRRVCDLFDDYLNSLPNINSKPESEITMTPWKAERDDWQTKLEEDKHRICKSLEIVFDSTRKSPQDAKKRVEAFIEMRNIPLFVEVGPGFLVELLKQQSISEDPTNGLRKFLENIYFETQWSARDEDTFVKKINSCVNRELYQQVMYIYSVLNNRGVDMRLIGNDMLNDPNLNGGNKSPECKDNALL